MRVEKGQEHIIYIHGKDILQAFRNVYDLNLIFSVYEIHDVKSTHHLQKVVFVYHFMGYKVFMFLRLGVAFLDRSWFVESTGKDLKCAIFTVKLLILSYTQNYCFNHKSRYFYFALLQRVLYLSSDLFFWTCRMLF